MAQPNGLDPEVNRIGINAVAKIFAGANNSASTIASEIEATSLAAALPAPALYFSSAGSGSVWVLQKGSTDAKTLWTQLTIN